MTDKNIEDFTEALAECREKSSFDERLRCEDDVSSEFKDSLESSGVDLASLDDFSNDAAKGMIRAMEKTGHTLDDVNMVDSAGSRGVETGVVEVRTSVGRSDFFIKDDKPRNIVLTKQVRNVSDIVEDDSVTVLHQDLNNGVLVMSDEGDPATSEDVQGMEAGQAAVTEAVLLDTDRTLHNLAVDDGVVSEIDFDRRWQSKEDEDDFAKLLNKMNRVSAGKARTVLGCGGWDEAISASPEDECVREPVSEKFREGIRSGAENFKEFNEKKFAPSFQDTAPMMADDAEGRVDMMHDFAEEGPSGVEYSETWL